MSVKLNQRGSSHLIAFLSAAVIIGVGAVGYRVLNNTTVETPESSVSISSNNAEVPDSINSAADAKKASAALDSTVIDGSINPNQLDNDISALL